MRAVMPFLSALLLACAASTPRVEPPPVDAEELAIAGLSRTIDESRLVDRVALEVDNTGVVARSLRVAAVERLHGSCEKPGWDTIEPMVVREPLGAVTFLPGEAASLAVVFDPVECASVCDRFGFRVHLEVDGAKRVVEVPVVAD